MSYFIQRFTTNYPSLKNLFLALILAASSGTYAITTSLMHTADVHDTKSYTVRSQADFIFSGDGGFVISPHFITGLINEYIDVDAFVGVGTIDFQAGANIKFNILPDFPKQVGLALVAGLRYVNEERENLGMANMAILASKKFYSHKFGVINPYAALEFGSVFESGTENSFGQTPVNFKFGSKVIPMKLKPWNFFLEANLELSKSYNSIAFGMSRNF